MEPAITMHESPIAASADALLHVQGVHTRFMSGTREVHAVNGVDLMIGRGEILGLVGESGCGKSALAMSILRLISAPGRIVAGRMLFDGKDIMSMTRHDLMQFRRKDVGIIFQQPQSCLNPVRRIGWQVADPFVQSGMSRREAWRAAVALLRAVEMPAPEVRAKSFPHQISGGQAQRVMIAIALARHPKLLIADEPTTALDVTIQAQILDLLRTRCREFGTALVLVTHDLGVVAQYADRVAVMYAGRIVEEAPTPQLLADARHPYTQGLLRAAPTLDTSNASAMGNAIRHADGHVMHVPRLQEIPGTLPDITRPIIGCAFAPRCTTRARLGLTRCATETPPNMDIASGHVAACWAESALAAASRDGERDGTPTASRWSQ